MNTTEEASKIMNDLPICVYDSTKDSPKKVQRASRQEFPVKLPKFSSTLVAFDFVSSQQEVPTHRLSASASSPEPLRPPRKVKPRTAQSQMLAGLPEVQSPDPLKSYDNWEANSHNFKYNAIFSNMHQMLAKNQKQQRDVLLKRLWIRELDNSEKRRKFPVLQGSASATVGVFAASGHGSNEIESAADKRRKEMEKRDLAAEATKALIEFNRVQAIHHREEMERLLAAQEAERHDKILQNQKQAQGIIDVRHRPRDAEEAVLRDNKKLAEDMRKEMHKEIEIKKLDDAKEMERRKQLIREIRGPNAPTSDNPLPMIFDY